MTAVSQSVPAPHGSACLFPLLPCPWNRHRHRRRDRHAIDLDVRRCGSPIRRRTARSRSMRPTSGTGEGVHSTHSIPAHHFVNLQGREAALLLLSPRRASCDGHGHDEPTYKTAGGRGGSPRCLVLYRQCWRAERPTPRNRKVETNQPLSPMSPSACSARCARVGVCSLFGHAYGILRTLFLPKGWIFVRETREEKGCQSHLGPALHAKKNTT